MDETEIAKLVIGIVGAGFVAWYWNAVNHKLAQYRYLDETYKEILKAYVDHPDFGQPELARTYREAFKGKDFWKYHYFSMQVHTFLETIFDLSNGKIPDVWDYVYRHHGDLHSAWLRDHRDLHEAGYVEQILETRQVAKG